jgi:hypothetical protein
MMIAVTQTRREITVRSARLDYVEIDKRVAVLPTYDTTIPATPTDTKAPSTKLLADQLAGKAPRYLTDEATTGPNVGKEYQMYILNGKLLWRPIVALILSIFLPAMADEEAVSVDSVSRETAQEVHFQGTITAPTPTSDSQVATKASSEAAAAGAVSAHDGAADPHHGKFDLAGSAAAITLSGLGAGTAATTNTTTSVATPGVDTLLPTEKAVRDAIAAIPAGVTGTTGTSDGLILAATATSGSLRVTTTGNDANGNLRLGNAVPGTNATYTLVIPIGNTPTTSPADVVQVYGLDNNGGGSASIGLRTESGATFAIGGTGTVADASRVQLSADRYGDFSLGSGVGRSWLIGVGSFNSIVTAHPYLFLKRADEGNFILSAGQSAGYGPAESKIIGAKGAGNHAGGSINIFGGNHNGTSSTEGSVTISNADGTTKVVEVNESKVGLFGVTPAQRQSAATTAVQLTDSSGGTSADTIAAIGATYTQTEVANAIATLAREVERLRTDNAALKTALQNYGLLQ